MSDMPAEPLEDRILIRNTDDHVVRIEQSDRWVRVIFNGMTVANSKRVRLVQETKRMPVYYFPVDDVRMDLLSPSGRTVDDAHKGTAGYHTVTVGSRSAEGAAWMFDNPLPAAAGLTGMVAFYWHKMDTWLEEDDEVYVHPRDPYHRVDVLHSSRHVRVVVLGQTVAESSRPAVLFETNLPTRFYLPRQDVRMDLLVDSPTTTQCPYKGVASYWSVRVGNTLAKDMAWAYRFPIPECPKIENLVCFFNERVDAIIVDGEEIAKPRTPWTKKPTLITVDD
jgi:uncharacterized protein (DUF427 family)